MRILWLEILNDLECQWDMADLTLLFLQPKMNIKERCQVELLEYRLIEKKTKHYVWLYKQESNTSDVKKRRATFVRLKHCFLLWQQLMEFIMDRMVLNILQNALILLQICLPPRRHLNIN